MVPCPLPRPKRVLEAQPQPQPWSSWEDNKDPLLRGVHWTPSLFQGCSAQTRKSGTQRGDGEESGGRGGDGELMVFPCGRESMILSFASPH